jgi:uncharacterized protein
MMNGKEREFLSELPERLAIYRGARQGTSRGMSWTLSHWRARWFASRTLKPRSVVARAVVDKRDVIAALLGRGEFEVIVPPERLRGLESVRSLRRSPRLQAVLDEAAATFPLGGRQLHGRWHWDAVERNAVALARETPGCDATVARLFACLHDARRENEEHDPEHGARGARFAEELFRAGRLPIGPAQLELLSEACRLHADGLVTNDPTLGVCWDADRLDLPRVGTVPDPALLSTEAGRRLLWRL